MSPVGLRSMKNSLTPTTVCGLGIAALLAGCTPTTPPAPTQSPTVNISPTVEASLTPSLENTPLATGTPMNLATPSATGTPTAAVDGLLVTIVTPGSGKAIAVGDAGKFHYTGWLAGFEAGAPFDSSKTKEPLPLRLGEGSVIDGWEKGLVGMTPGEVRRLEISPELGYGADGYPPLIPQNATLFFEVEYLGPGQ